MISAPLAHVGGLPIEETLGSLGPALLVGFGVAGAKLRARLHPMRSRARAHAPPQEGGVQCGPANLNSNSDDESVALPQGRHTPSALRPGGPAQNQPRRATPLLLAANASISTCAEFTAASDDQQASGSTPASFLLLVPSGRLPMVV